MMSLLDQYRLERQRSRQRRADNRGFQQDLQGGIQQLEVMRQQIAKEDAARKAAEQRKRLEDARLDMDIAKAGREADRFGFEKKDLWDPERRLKVGQAEQQEYYAGTMLPERHRGLQLQNKRYELETPLKLQLGDLDVQGRQHDVTRKGRIAVGDPGVGALFGRATGPTGVPVTPDMQFGDWLDALDAKYGGSGRTVQAIMSQVGSDAKARGQDPSGFTPSDALDLLQQRYEAQRRALSAEDYKDRQLAARAARGKGGKGPGKKKELFGAVTREQGKLTKYGVREYDPNQFAARTGLGVEKSFARGGKGDRKGLEGPKLKRHNDKLEALEAVTEVNAMMADGNFDTGRIKAWANNVKKIFGVDDPKLTEFEAQIGNFIDIEQRLRSGAAAPFQEALKIAGFIGNVDLDEDSLRGVLSNTTTRTRREFDQLREGYASAGLRLPKTNFDHYGRLLTDPESIRHRKRLAVEAMGPEGYMAVFKTLATKYNNGQIPPKGSPLWRELESAAAELIYQQSVGGVQ